MYEFAGVHISGVSSIALIPQQQGLITGGRDGEIRTWKTGYLSSAGKPVSLLSTVREHKKEVTSLQVAEAVANSDEAVSASMDGSCIIWSLAK